MQSIIQLLGSYDTKLWNLMVFHKKLPENICPCISIFEINVNILKLKQLT